MQKKTNKNLRNIAIIAHVDHGKTTLVDKLLQQSGTFKKHEEFSERIMDSNDLEKERGITILAKNTAIQWKKYRINIIDTPGHADFGGEVERILSMVDSVLLVVDALEGPMPQTRFVTQKAFSYGIKPIVVINKIDRKHARPNWVIDQIFDLFVNLNATDEQLDFPTIYTSALLGTSGVSYNHMNPDMIPLYNAIVKYTPPPTVYPNCPFQMQISQLDYDNYLGIIGIGRINKGSVTSNQSISIINNTEVKRTGKIGKILQYLGLNKIEINEAQSGDIIAITGIDKLNISDTICDPQYISALPMLKIDEPTVEMLFSVNKSPFSGTEGKYITSRQIFNRLKKEENYNVALKIKETNDTNTFSVSGRGELHLSILIENMRREGFELEVSRPQVILKTINELIQEPMETVVLDIENKYQGTIMKTIGQRKGTISNITPDQNNERTRLDCIISSRSLIGFRTEFSTLTSGSGLFYSTFSHYQKIESNKIKRHRNGVLIANKTGQAIGFSLFNLQNRGKLFITHGTKVYEGQIVGIHNRVNDLTVNCLSGKKLTNMRASGSDEAITLTTPIKMTLEYAISFINDDELVEITPKSIRLRKRYLKENERKILLRNIKE
ncbi:translational GTPase TypA [Buchnera aphidicola]|uniref:Large ribosomal subunit assembly factor BipA n=1 Tax=Buchnera aphidicola subsp. Baizongia pistaciae (strain Bp) TaxID=224915 RepID=BIPA_BUCBP|nr:translational GTPase TypA [Buchnera aphidicola]Q89AC9.2 RecName: Full=Large ribosomal subunit assembly factor BipA; AltName: Full=50S ribosomal subunit assembly factor BipA; AltName: Full=GTP-binding protein BipA [Buchnera aphidicola str. Bp (Baizongia pistaciae)]